MADQKDITSALDWRRIQSEARAVAIAAEGTPLQLGQSVAWAECRFGRTNDLSRVHRADDAKAGDSEDQKTLCGDRVPMPVLRIALSPNLVRTLGRCQFCEAEYQRHIQSAKHFTANPAKVA